MVYFSINRYTQDYTYANLQFKDRFSYGQTEERKKADLMFLQHMLASTNTKGKMAVVMPHGILFRKGREQDIREGLLMDNILEGIISLPPKLFYGTGIPACIMIFNRNKPDELRDKVFFINADAEYGEGKKQNHLRPEDIEKIDFVFTHKIIENKYSKLVDLSDIAAQEFNLNIRRYVDNTPDPEPQDVRAHLVGGVPVSEIMAAKFQTQCQKFGITPDLFFTGDGANYRQFKTEVTGKEYLNDTLDKQPELQKVFDNHAALLAAWWEDTQSEFSKIAVTETELTLDTDDLEAARKQRKKHIPEVRRHLLQGIKNKLIPQAVLDQYQSAAVFVNWWDNIKYDLKTLSNIGWSEILIPDSYLIARFFQVEQTELDTITNTIANKDNQLQEAIEAAQEVMEYEPEEDEKVTNSSIKAELKIAIVNLQMGKQNAAAKKWLLEMKAADEKIGTLEKFIKTQKDLLQSKTDDLQLKINIKRYGAADEKYTAQQLLNQADAEFEKLNTIITDLIAPFASLLEKSSSYDLIKKSTTALHKKVAKGTIPDINVDKISEAIRRAKKEYKNITKRYNGLRKDKITLKSKIQKIDIFDAAIGGILLESEAKDLILQKHHDLIDEQLTRFLQNEKRRLQQHFDKLFAKYAVSAQAIESSLQSEMQQLNQFLTDLNYLG